MENADKFTEWLLEVVTTYVPKLLIAIIALIVGLWLVKKVILLLQNILTRSGLPSDIIPSLASFADVLLKIVLIFGVAGLVGIETASFVAIFAAAGFAVGMALQGSLGNFAAGVLILFFKPYRIGDWIEVEDRFGQVEEIQIFNTLIVTPGQKTVIVPNGQIIENIVVNYSNKGHVRLELSISMPYAESFPKVKRVIMDTLRDIPFILQEPTPQVGIESYDSHNIIITIRPYVEPEQYWDATFAIHEQVKLAFHQNGIQVAYSEGVELGNIGE